MSEPLKSPRGEILMWQGIPTNDYLKKGVLTGASRWKWYPGDVVVVAPDGSVQAISEFVSEEAHSEIWGWTHAPDPFKVIALAEKHNWLVDPHFAARLFDNFYGYTCEMSNNDRPTFGPFADVDPEAIRVQSLRQRS